MKPSTPSLDISWSKPTFLLPLYCLAALLGCTDSLASGIGLSLVMTTLMLVTSLLSMAIARTARHSAWVWLILCSGIIALFELWLHAFAFALYRKLGLYLPLCTLGMLLLTRDEMLSENLSLAEAFKRTLQMSAGFALAAVVLGTGRELVGHGSLLADASELFGPWAAPLAIQFFRPDMSFLLGILAPGAFVALGLGVALYNQLALKVTAFRE